MGGIDAEGGAVNPGEISGLQRVDLEHGKLLPDEFAEHLVVAAQVLDEVGVPGPALSVGCLGCGICKNIEGGEGMPLSLLEAMSYGNCCVVSDIPECTEATEDKAISFPKGNVTALRECLQKLCDDSHLVADYKAQASEYICGKYSWDATAEKTLALYREKAK